MKELTQARLKELLHYEPTTGVFTRLVGTSHNAKAGSIAGGVSHGGRYRIISVRAKLYYAHRLAWLYIFGVWPKIQVDHANGDRRDNRLCNLREATRRENSWNVGLRRDNTSGFRGVSWHRQKARWCARIWVRGRCKCLGYFHTPEAASTVYEAEATNLFGKFKYNQQHD